MNFSNLSYRALRRLRLQPALNWTARLPDVDITVPLLGEPLGLGLMLYGASWKQEAFRRLARCLPMSMVLDVGANEGQTIVDLTRAGLGNLETLVFEPNPACAYFLERLIWLNDLRHVSLLPLALSDGARCTLLELAFENDSGASLIPTLRPGLRIKSRQIVPCFSLDQLIEAGTVKVRPNFLLKIDVEGAELDVLRGSRSALLNSRPLILCEVLWAHCEERVAFMRDRNSALTDLLRECGYVANRLVLSEDQRSLCGLEGIAQLPSGIYSPQNAHQCDYLFIPREYSGSVTTGFLNAT